MPRQEGLNFWVLPQQDTEHGLTVLGGWTDGKFGVYVFDDDSHHWFKDEKEAAAFLKTYDPKRHELN